MSKQTQSLTGNICSSFSNGDLDLGSYTPKGNSNLFLHVSFLYAKFGHCRSYYTMKNVRNLRIAGYKLKRLAFTTTSTYDHGVWKCSWHNDSHVNYLYVRCHLKPVRAKKKHSRLVPLWSFNRDRAHWAMYLFHYVKELVHVAWQCASQLMKTVKKPKTSMRHYAKVFNFTWVFIYINSLYAWMHFSCL